MCFHFHFNFQKEFLDVKTSLRTVTRLNKMYRVRGAQVLPRYSLLSKYHRVSRCMCTFNFISLPGKSKAFSAPIFMKLINPEQKYVKISYSEFHPYRTINVERTSVISMDHSASIFTILTINQ